MRVLKVVASWARGGGVMVMWPKKDVTYFKMYHTPNRNTARAVTGGRW